MISQTLTVTGASRPIFATPQGVDLAFSEVLRAPLYSLGSALSYAGGKLLDGADYMLDKLLSMPETLASLPSAIAYKLTGGLVGSSIKLENKFEGAASSPITVRTNSGETVTIPAAQGNHLLRGLLSSIGMADDTEYSMFEYRNGKVQVNNTSSRKAFTTDEANKINKLDSFVDKDGKEYERLQFVDKANGVELDRSIAVFEGPNKEKMMIMKDGSVIQSMQDDAGKITNKLWTANGKEIQWELNAANAKGAAMVNYNSATKKTIIDGTTFNLFGPERWGTGFSNWALDGGAYNGSAMGTDGAIWLAMTKNAQATNVYQLDVSALNYGRAEGGAHSTGRAMDVTNMHYTYTNSQGQNRTGMAMLDILNRSGQSTRDINKVLEFNRNFSEANGGNVNIFSPFQMGGGQYGGLITNPYSDRAANPNLSWPIGSVNGNRLVSDVTQRLQATNPSLYTDGYVALMLQHLNHGHYYLR